MSDDVRTTRGCNVSQIPAEPFQAIQEFYRKHELGDPKNATLACCETKTEKEEAGKLLTWLEGEQDTLMHTWLLLTAEWLVWVRSGDRSGIVLNAAKLDEIQVKAHKSIFSKDSGLDILGYIGESKNRVRGYIGMGKEPVVQEFLEQVSKAIDDRKPKSKERGWFRWFRR